MNRRFSTADENLRLRAYDAAEPPASNRSVLLGTTLSPLNSLTQRAFEDSPTVAAPSGASTHSRFFLPARLSRRRLIPELEEGQMQVLYLCCCGIDVHAKTAVACLIKQGKRQTRTHLLDNDRRPDAPL